MDEKRFDELIRDLPRTFNPPPSPPLDEMWTVIEEAHFNVPASLSSRRATMISRAPWLAAAATLLIGIGVGRYIPRVTKNRGDVPHSASAAPTKSAASLPD